MTESLGQTKLSYPVVKKAIPVGIKENSPRKRRIETKTGANSNVLFSGIIQWLFAILAVESEPEDVSPSKRVLSNKYSLRSTPAQSIPLVKFYSEKRPILTANESPEPSETPDRLTQTSLKAPQSQPVTSLRPARKCLDFTDVTACKLVRTLSWSNYRSTTWLISAPSTKSVLTRQLPTQLSCRECELETLKTWLSGCLEEQKPKSFYISGPPGTGKTACLKRTMAVLKVW